MKKTTLEEEIRSMANLYNSTNLEVARGVYDQYVGLILADENKKRQNELYKLWNELKGDEEWNHQWGNLNNNYFGGIIKCMI